MPKLYFQKTSEYPCSALSTLYGTALSPYIKRKIDGILLAYGENDETYIEPVYGLASGKRSTRTTTERPDKPTSTFKLQPNPAKNYTELHWDGFAEGLQNAFTVNIYTNTGILLSNFTVKDFLKNSWIIDTEKLTTGLYIIEIEDANGINLSIQKLIIQK